MKKILFLFLSLCLLSANLVAQEIQESGKPASTTNPDPVAAIDLDIDANYNIVIEDKADDPLEVSPIGGLVYLSSQGPREKIRVRVGAPILNAIITYRQDQIKIYSSQAGTSGFKPSGTKIPAGIYWIEGIKTSSSRCDVTITLDRGDWELAPDEKEPKWGQIHDTNDVTVLEVVISSWDFVSAEYTKVNDQTVPRLIGEAVQMRGVLMPKGVIVEDSKLWTIPGVKFKMFSPTPASSEYEEFDKTTLLTPKVFYRWITGMPTPRTIKYTVTTKLKSKPSFEGIAYFNVPRVDSTMKATYGNIACDDYVFTGKDKKPVPPKPEDPPVVVVPQTTLHYGELWRTWAKDTPGALFEHNSDLNQLGGDTGFLQVVNTTKRVHKRQSYQGMSKIFWQLEINATEAFDSFGYNPFLGYPKTSDSPGSEPFWSDTIEFSINDTFSMFLMYKSNAPTAHWVPLRKIDWEWSAKAEGTKDSWSLTSSSKSGDAVGPKHHVHPKWTNKMSDHKMELTIGTK